MYVPLINEEGTGNYFKNKPLSIDAYALPGHRFVGWESISDSSILNYNCVEDTVFTALFESSEEIILPDLISEDTVLINEHSYIVSQNLLIPSGITLTIQEGVQLRMLEGSSLVVEGKLLINGTEDNPVQITGHTSTMNNRWGAICFDNASDTSHIRHTKISGASLGVNPSVHRGAISGINSHII